MLISVQELMRLGMSEQTLYRLAGLDGTEASNIISEVSKAGIEILRRTNEEGMSLDPLRPQHHVLTISGQIVGLRDLPRLIHEAAVYLRDQQQQESRP